MASPNPPLFRPDLSNIEQKLDPIARGNQGDFETALSDASIRVSRHPLLGKLPTEKQAALAERGARLQLASEARERRQRLDRTNEVLGPGGNLAVAGSAESLKQSGSLLDSTGLGVLRDANTVSDAFPVIGSLGGSVLARRFVPPAAQQFLGRSLTAAKALTQTETGLTATGSVLGATMGAVMERQLQDASAAAASGEFPGGFSAAPTLGFFLTGPPVSPTDRRPFTSRFRRLANDAMQESFLDAAGLLTGDLLARGARRTLSALIGDEKFARNVLDSAEQMDVPVGLINVVDDRSAVALKSLRRVLGAMGPLGSPFRANLADVSRSVSAAARRQVAGLSNEIGLVAERAANGEDVTRLSRVLNERDLKRFNSVYTRYVVKRDELFSAALTRGGKLLAPAGNLMTEAAELEAALSVKSGKSARLIRKEVLEENPIERIRQLSPEELEMFADDLFENPAFDPSKTGLSGILDKIKRLEPHPTVERLADLSQDLNTAIIDEPSTFVSKKLMDLRRAVTRDIESALSKDPETLAQYQTAKGFSEEWITLLSGSGARSVRNIAPDFGKQKIQTVRLPDGERIVKNPGPVDSTLLLDTLGQAKSAGEVVQLATMLNSLGQDGRRTFRRIAATRMNTAFSPSGKTGEINPVRGVNILGLLNPASKQGRASMEMIRQAGGSPEAARKLAKLAVQVIPPGLTLDSSATALRRAGLAGLASGLTAIVGGFGLTAGGSNGSLLQGVGVAVVALGLARGAGEILTNPTLTRAALDLLSKETSPLVQRRAVQILFASGAVALGETAEEISGSGQRAVSGIQETFGGFGASRPTGEPLAVQTPLPPARN